MLHPYRESLSSQLYPGSQHSSPCLKPAVERVEELLSLPEAKRSKVTWRTDQGFGGDSNINWLLERGYGVLMKGRSNRRAANLAQKVQRWHPLPGDRYAGRVLTPTSITHSVDTIVMRYSTAKAIKHFYLFSTLKMPIDKTVLCYDERGGSETGFRSDKSGGLQLQKRRKHKRDAQEVWILLTDMAHNYLAWLAHTVMRDSPLASFGFLRTTRDLFRIPGKVEIQDGKLRSVKLLESSPYSDDMLGCLQRFWQ
jgi:Transposase DDE domain.